MNLDEKIEMMKKIICDSGESLDTIRGPICYGPQEIGLTKAGRSHTSKLFNSGNLSNSLNDCTIVVKIENRKAQLSVIHEEIVVMESKPVDPNMSSEFCFTGVSLPLKMGW